MPAAAMSVPPSIVRREQLVQRVQQVLLRATAGLHDRDAGGRVRHEHVRQPVATGVADEVGYPAGDVGDAVAITRTHLERRGLHDQEA